MKDKKKPLEKDQIKGEENLPGYKHYPEEEDIYNQALEETELDPEDPTKLKMDNEEPETLNEKSFEESVSGDDLDIPGNEQDEENMSDVMPDEENNYYSLGGDNHESLEENTGDKL